VTGEVQQGPDKSRMVRLRIGGRVVQALKVNACKTCQHPARMQIEEGILFGDSYRALARQYSGVEYTVGRETKILPELNWQSIQRHYQRGHSPIDSSVVREILEDRATELGSGYEAAGARFIDHVATSKVILAMGHEGLVSGTLRPDVKDTLAAAKFLHEVEKTAKDDQNAEAWNAAMEVYFQVARELMPESLWNQFVIKLSTNPILLELSRKAAGEDSDVLEGEYEEEDVTS
jgi:hypothetical protein